LELILQLSGAGFSGRIVSGNHSVLHEHDDIAGLFRHLHARFDVGGERGGDDVGPIHVGVDLPALGGGRDRDGLALEGPSDQVAENVIRLAVASAELAVVLASLVETGDAFVEGHGMVSLIEGWN